MNKLVNDLYNKIDNQDKIINEQVLEIARLKNKIDEAINYIDDNTYYKSHKGHINIDDLYIILKGVEE